MPLDKNNNRIKALEAWTIKNNDPIPKWTAN